MSENCCCLQFIILHVSPGDAGRADGDRERGKLYGKFNIFSENVSRMLWIQWMFWLLHWFISRASEGKPGRRVSGDSARETFAKKCLGISIRISAEAFSAHEALKPNEIWHSSSCCIMMRGGGSCLEVSSWKEIHEIPSESKQTHKIPSESKRTPPKKQAHIRDKEIKLMTS